MRFLSDQQLLVKVRRGEAEVTNSWTIDPIRAQQTKLAVPAESESSGGLNVQVTGALVAIEPWNYDTSKNPWPIPTADPDALRDGHAPARPLQRQVRFLATFGVNLLSLFGSK